MKMIRAGTQGQGLHQLQIFLVKQSRQIDWTDSRAPQSNGPHQEHFHWEHDTIGL